MTRQDPQVKKTKQDKDITRRCKTRQDPRVKKTEQDKDIMRRCKT